MKNLKIGARLGLGFAVVVSLLIAMTIIGVMRLAKIDESMTLVTEDRYPKVRAAQRLMDIAHEELARDYDHALLTVLTANARARRFYERNGWELVETLVEPHFGGTPTEVSRYRKRFR